MIHLPPLIEDLAWILAVAGAVTLLFKAIRQPVVLGYLIAGFLLSPHIEFLPSVTDSKNIHVWAEIGVIFLLFALGLEFSFKKLSKVGSPATITALAEVAFMGLMGYGFGQLMNWSTMDSVFLGGILAISSTTIIFRAFEETGVKGKGFVQLVFGVLIVEDLVAVLLMVLLSTVAISQTVSGLELITSTSKLGFFLVLWFILGIFLLPSFLSKIRSYLNDETLLVVSLGLCLTMVLLATKAGFSPALGAFIMGSILAETTFAEKIEHLVGPVKNLFSAIFFVSVGMLINPEILVEYAVPILAITFLTIFGKVFSIVVGSLLAGQTLRTSVQAGMSLAQIGEFSFIIASLGLSLGVTSEFLYPIAVSVSVLTTFTTPYLIKWADPLSEKLEKKMPQGFLNFVDRYAANIQRASGTGLWSSFLKSYVRTLIINLVIVISIFYLVDHFFVPLVEEALGHTLAAKLLSFLFGLMVASPFLWAMTLRKISGTASQFTFSAMGETSATAFGLIRWVVTLAVIAAISIRIIHPLAAVLISLGVGLLFYWKGERFLARYYRFFEKQFLANFSSRERALALEKKGRHEYLLAPWDAHLESFTVPPQTPLAGKSLGELQIRERLGVSVIMIERGLRRILAPQRDERIFPNDKISVLGNDDQILNFKEFIEAEVHGEDPLQGTEHFALEQVTVGPGFPYLGQTIRDSKLREETRGLVVGLERGGKRYLNPHSEEVLQEGDLLWMVGDVGKIRDIKSPQPTLT